MPGRHLIARKDEVKGQAHEQGHEEYGEALQRPGQIATSLKPSCKIPRRRKEASPGSQESNPITKEQSVKRRRVDVVLQ